jgi:shikimate kinase
MALRIHYLPSEVLKWNFGDVDEAMFHDVEMSFERIFYILGIEYSDLDEVVEVMF